MRQRYQMWKDQGCSTVTDDVHPEVCCPRSVDVHTIIRAQENSPTDGLALYGLQKVGDHCGSVQKKEDLVVPRKLLKVSTNRKEPTHSLDSRSEGVTPRLLYRQTGISVKRAQKETQVSRDASRRSEKTCEISKFRWKNQPTITPTYL